MIELYTLDNGKFVACEDGQAQLFLIAAPDDGEKAFLTERYQIDEHTLNSALDPDELARLENEPGHTAIIFKIPVRYDPKSLNLPFLPLDSFSLPIG